MMDKRSEIIQILNIQGLMPLFFNADIEISGNVLKALYTAGVRIVEYTNRGPEALANFKILKSLAENEMPDLFLGIGTIKNNHQANLFIDAGADFLISPALAEDVFDAAYNSKTLWIPGCMTVTEILKAENYGLTLVKLFPGNVLGPSFVTAIKDLFPAMQFMPTGGVDTTAENISQWFSSGVCAVGMGSKLISNSVIENRDYQKITNTSKAVLQIIASIKAATKN